MPSSETQARALSDAIAGTVAALLSLWCFYPIDVYKTLVQSNTAVSTTTKMDALWAGVHWKSAHAAASNFVYFYLYSWIQRVYLKRNHQQPPSILMRLLMAAVAALGNTFVTLPFDVISTREQQQQQNVHNHSTTEHQPPRSLASKEAQQQQRQQIIQQYVTNLSGYWKGLIPSLLLCANPSIHYTVFDTLRYRILFRNNMQHRQLHWLEAFYMGAIAKLVATLATYPLIRAKMLLMTQSAQQGLWNTLQQEYNERGSSGLYQGCRLQLIHTLLKSALLMMIRERLTEVTHRLRNTRHPLAEER